MRYYLFMGLLALLIAASVQHALAGGVQQCVGDLGSRRPVACE